MKIKMVEWTEDLSVGVEVIDQQHKKLFDMINRFYAGLEDGDTGALDQLLSSLADYALYHFATEEQYFESIGHPESEQHKKSHQGFVDKIDLLRQRLRSGRNVLSLEVTDFLRNWTMNHMKNEDPKYKKYLLSRYGE